MLAVAGAVGAGGAFDADGERAGRGEVEGVEVDLADLAVEPDGFVGERQGERDGDVGRG